MFYSESLVLSTTANEIKEQILDEYGSEVLNEMIFSGKKFKDEYDMRRYAIYLSKDERHLIILTTGCSKEEYDKDNNNLPEIHELLDCFKANNDGRYKYPINQEDDKNIMFVYKWQDERIEYLIIDDEKAFDRINDDNYYAIIANLEKYI